MRKSRASAEPAVITIVNAAARRSRKTRSVKNPDSGSSQRVPDARDGFIENTREFALECGCRNRSVRPARRGISLQLVVRSRGVQRRSRRDGENRLLAANATKPGRDNNLAADVVRSGAVRAPPKSSPAVCRFFQLRIRSAAISFYWNDCYRRAP
jgi:hypothetical protein